MYVVCMYLHTITRASLFEKRTSKRPFHNMHWYPGMNAMKIKYIFNIQPCHAFCIYI